MVRQNPAAGLLKVLHLVIVAGVVFRIFSSILNAQNEVKRLRKKGVKGVRMKRMSLF